MKFFGFSPEVLVIRVGINDYIIYSGNAMIDFVP
jgi:hypothetical protein